MDAISNGQGTSLERSIRFRLTAERTDVLTDVRLRRAGERWISISDSGGREVTGIGSTAQAAIQASLDWLGPTAVRELLADLRLLDVSLQLTGAAGR